MKPTNTVWTIGWVVLLWMLAASLAGADVVHLIDGGRHVGEVSREGAEYVIQTDDGTVRVHESDVLWVQTGQADRSPSPAPAPVPRQAEPPAAEPAAPQPPDPLADKLDVSASAGAPTEADRPEPMVFHLMTALQANPTGMTSAGLRHRLEVWQMAVKDRKRKVGVRWLLPKSFLAARETFIYGINEARELARDLRPRRGLSPRQQRRAERKRADAVSAKLRQAARDWLDPLMGQFFSAAATLVGEDDVQAQRRFEGCIRRQPMVAAFHQGRGLALAGQDRHAEAAAAFLEALKLKPDSRQAVAHLRQAVEDTRGANMRDPAFLAAQEMLRQYPEPRRRSRRTSRRDERIYWMLPGEDIYGRDMTLPIPEYDRIDLRQGLGVPVSERALLVDREVVDGALEVYVRVDDQTLIPAAVRRRRSYRRDDDDAPLSLIYPAAARLTPVPVAQAATLTAGQKATAYALPSFAGAGEAVVPLATTVSSADPNAPAVGADLLPGSAAGPVMTDDGTLAGFLAARTDPFADNGGPDVFHGPTSLTELVEDAEGRFKYRFSRTKRDPRIQDVPGTAFIVYALHGERFEK
jgi:tetratricopeptide (TPR) repeat protein